MHRILTFIAALLAVDLVLAALYLGWSHAVVAQEPPPGRTFDAGMLFFSGFTPDGSLDAEGRARVRHGAELFAQGRVTHLVCLGGYRENLQRFGAQLMAEELRSLGVPAAAMRVDRHSFDTIGNWQQGIAFLQREDWDKPLLISGPLHLARIRSVAAGDYLVRLSPHRSVWERIKDAPLGTWGMVHREWSAWLAMWLLPADTHRELVGQWRNFWD